MMDLQFINQSTGKIRSLTNVVSIYVYDHGKPIKVLPSQLVTERYKYENQDISVFLKNGDAVVFNYDWHLIASSR